MDPARPKPPLGCSRPLVDCDWVRVLVDDVVEGAVGVTTKPVVEFKVEFDAEEDDAVAEGCFRRGVEMMVLEIPDDETVLVVVAAVLLVVAVEEDAKLKLLPLTLGRCRALRSLPAAIQGCRMAGSGLSRRSGSQARHFEMKSTNRSSSVLSTAWSVLEPTRRRRPLGLVTGLGAPVESVPASRQ